MTEHIKPNAIIEISQAMLQSVITLLECERDDYKKRYGKKITKMSAKELAIYADDLIYRDEVLTVLKKGRR